MARKISLVIVTVGAALVLAVPAVAQSSRGGGRDVRPRIQPTLHTDGQQQIWQAGNRLMY